MSIFTNKSELIEYFESIDNVFLALEIKQNLEEAMKHLKTPSPELLAMLEKEGISKDSFIANEPAINPAVQTTKRQINYENRSFLIEGDKVVKMLVGRAVNSAIDKGLEVKKFNDLNSSQQEQAKNLPH